jgi:hypothetical protein
MRCCRRLITVKERSLNLGLAGADPEVAGRQPRDLEKHNHGGKTNSSPPQLSIFMKKEPPSQSPPQTNPPILFDHQKEAFQKLRRAGRVCFSSERHNLPLRLRTNSLVIGPSGCGKTHLARLVAESLGVGCKILNSSEWILLGSGSSAGARKTWHSIFDFLVENQSKKGVMIFLDEIDKLNGSTDWMCHLRVEVFHLLDHALPGDLLNSFERRIDKDLFKAASETLRNRTFIVGAGAFQAIWEIRSRPVCGFLPGNQEREVPPTSNILANYLPRELVNRFCSNIATMSLPGPADYESMLLGCATRLPPHLQDRFLSLGEARIPEACRNKQGVRFIEELLTDMIAEDVDPMVPILPETTIWRREPHRTFPPNLR